MLVVDRAALLRAVDGVRALAPADATVEVRAEEPGTVLVTAGTFAGGARCSAVGRVILPGVLVLPLAPLAGALRCGPASCRVEVCANATTAVVVVDADGAPRKLTFDVAGAGARVPPWPAVPAGATAASVAAGPFARAVALSAFTATTGARTARGWATGALRIDLGNGRLTLSATDGLRFATAAVAGDTSGPPATALVPAAAVRAAAVAAGLAGETFRIAVAPDAVLFTVGPLSVWAARDPGHVPDPARIDPRPPHVLGVAADRLRAELAAATAVADPAAPRVLIGARAGALTLAAGRGRTRVELTVPAPGYRGPGTGVPVDGRLLDTILRAYRESPVTLALGDAAEPVVLSAGDARCVLVPLAPE
jgi:hypothetical protein